MRSDEQIIGADKRASPLQVGADLGVVERRAIGEVHRLNIGEKRRERGGILGAPGRDLDPPW